MNKPQGFTLIEVMVVVAVAAILAAVAAPSFSDFIDKTRVRGSVENMVSDISFAKSESVRRGENIFFNFATGNGSCYAIGTSAGCDCSSCDVKKKTNSAFLADYSGVSITAASNFSFSPRIGAPSAAVVIELTSARSGRVAKISMNELGFASVCMKVGSMSGWSACP